MPQNKVRKKNGKKVKYSPKPKGISKTKMAKIMKLMEQYKKMQEQNSEGIAETRDGGEIAISSEFSKKINMASDSDTINSGPELLGEKIEYPDDVDHKYEKSDAIDNFEGPQSSNI